jgi:hypothetical protein
MREIRTYGSEGGEARKGLPYPYPALLVLFAVSDHSDKMMALLQTAKVLPNVQGEPETYSHFPLNTDSTNPAIAAHNPAR